MRATQPYPDDLDDTFTALAALSLAAPHAISGEVLAHATTLLLSQEANEGGPYLTWVLPDAHPKITNAPDPAVNATVGYFLALQGVYLSHLDTYLTSTAQKIRDRKPSLRTPEDFLLSHYYPNTITVAYFLSRYFSASPNPSHNGRRFLGAFLSEYISRSFSSPSFSSFSYSPPSCFSLSSFSLNAILAINALVRCGYRDAISPHIVSLFKESISRNVWHADPFCFDPSRHGVKYCAGSRALTAALSLETYALLIHQPPSSNPPSHTPYPHAHRTTSHLLHRSSCNNIAQTLSHSSHSPRVHTALRNAIARASSPFITEPVRAVCNALRLAGHPIPSSSIRTLTEASLYGWVAYDIYDDFLDNEGDPALLPVATLLLQYMTHAYASLSLTTNHPAIYTLCTSALEHIAEADCDEIAVRQHFSSATPETFFNTPSLSYITKRSAGYTLAPRVALRIAKLPAHSPAEALLSSCLTHFLIARQLNDDSRDWETDLARHHPTGIIAMIAGACRIRFPEYAHTPLSNLLPQLRECFLRDTAPRVANAMRSHIHSARIFRESCDLLRGLAFMEEPFSLIDEAADNIVQHHTHLQSFIDTFSNRKNDTP